MSITKYRTHNGIAIEKVEVERETEASVFVRCVRGVAREAKVSTWSRYHDTWEAAHAHLLGRAEQRLTSARLALQSAQGELGNIKGMRKP